MDLNEARFNQYVREGERPVLVEFQAPWCGYCRRIVPAMKKIEEQYEGRLLVGYVNIDDEPGLADREQVEVVPTLILYQNGKYLGSLVVPDSKAKIDSFIAETLNK